MRDYLHLKKINKIEYNVGIKKSKAQATKEPSIIFPEQLELVDRLLLGA